VEPEKAGGRDERERHEEEPGVPAMALRGSDGIAEDDVQRGRGEHEPEMRGVVLPVPVDRRLGQHEHEPSCAYHEREA
jgi:hypothetical protein